MNLQCKKLKRQEKLLHKTISLNFWLLLKVLNFKDYKCMTCFIYF